MAFKKAKSFSLISFLTRLLIFVLILLTIGYFVGNYLIVKFFGENGSVLPLGATGWGDIVTVATALKSSEPEMAEEDRASDENEALLTTNLQGSFNPVNLNSFTDNQLENFALSFGYESVTEMRNDPSFPTSYNAYMFQLIATNQTPNSPLTLNGGMMSSALNWAFDNLVSSNVEGLKDILKFEAMNFTSGEDGAIVCETTISISKEKAIQFLSNQLSIGEDITDKVLYYFGGKKTDKMYVTGKFDFKLFNNKIDTGYDSKYGFKLNDSSYEQCKILNNLVKSAIGETVNLYTYFAPIIDTINNFGNLSFNSETNSLIIG